MGSVEEYISGLEPPYRLRVEQLREIVKAAAPEAVERFSYGVIMFKTEYDLVGIGTAKGVISLYAMGMASAPEFAERLGHFKIKGKTLHLPLDQEWDEELLRALVLARVDINHMRAQKSLDKR